MAKQNSKHCENSTCKSTRSDPDQHGRTCGCSCKGCNPPIDEMGTGAGAVVGFQMPLGIRKRKKRVKEMLVANPDIGVREAVHYFSSLDEGLGEVIGRRLDAGSYGFVADAIREHLIREVVSSKVREVVRKKKGADSYILYRPNKGKKGAPKPVGTFPNKLAAKRAELAKFPPPDPAKRARLGREIQRLAHSKKNPAKGKESGTPEQFAARRAREKAKKEEFLRPLVSTLILESLMKEDPQRWIQFLNKVPKAALTKDQKFVNLQRRIDRKAEKVLEAAFKALSRAVGKTGKLRSHGVRRDDANRPFISFTAEIGQAEADPFYIRLGDDGRVTVEVTQKAKGDLAKVDPDVAKLFRAELITAQEQVLDGMDDAQEEMGKRDAYLERTESDLDSFVSELSPMGLSLLKQLLVQKYRKVG